MGKQRLALIFSTVFCCLFLLEREIAIATAPLEIEHKERASSLITKCSCPDFNALKDTAAHLSLKAAPLKKRPLSPPTLKPLPEKLESPSIGSFDWFSDILGSCQKVVSRLTTRFLFYPHVGSTESTTLYKLLQRPINPKLIQPMPAKSIVIPKADLSFYPFISATTPRFEEKIPLQYEPSIQGNVLDLPTIEVCYQGPKKLSLYIRPQQELFKPYHVGSENWSRDFLGAFGSAMQISKTKALFFGKDDSYFHYDNAFQKIFDLSPLPEINLPQNLSQGTPLSLPLCKSSSLIDSNFKSSVPKSTSLSVRKLSLSTKVVNLYAPVLRKKLDVSKPLELPSNFESEDFLSKISSPKLHSETPRALFAPEEHLISFDEIYFYTCLVDCDAIKRGSFSFTPQLAISQLPFRSLACAGSKLLLPYQCKAPIYTAINEPCFQSINALCGIDLKETKVACTYHELSFETISPSTIDFPLQKPSQALFAKQSLPTFPKLQQNLSIISAPFLKNQLATLPQFTAVFQANQLRPKNENSRIQITTHLCLDPLISLSPNQTFTLVTNDFAPLSFELIGKNTTLPVLSSNASPLAFPKNSFLNELNVITKAPKITKKPNFLIMQAFDRGKRVVHPFNIATTPANIHMLDHFSHLKAPSWSSQKLFQSQVHVTMIKSRPLSSYVSISDKAKRANQELRLTHYYLAQLPSLEELTTDSLGEEFMTQVRVLPRLTDEGYVFSVEVCPQTTNSLYTLDQSVYFILDTSKSIEKHRFNIFKRAIQQAVNYLDNTNTFNIFTIGNGIQALHKKELKAQGSRASSYAKRFLANIEQSNYTSSEDLYSLIETLERQSVEEGKICTAVLLSDGNLFKNMRLHRNSIAGFLDRSNSFFSLYTACISDRNNIGMLDWLAKLYHGDMLHTRTHAAFPRRFSMMVKKLKQPLAHDIHVYTASPDTNVTFFHDPKIAENLFAGKSYRIYGIAKKLQDIDLIIQGKAGDKWLNLTKKVSLQTALKGRQRLEKETACQRALLSLHEYIQTNSSQKLLEAKTTALEYDIPFPAN